jgi:hypothetical protein
MFRVDDVKVEEKAKIGRPVAQGEFQSIIIFVIPTIVYLIFDWVIGGASQNK